MADYDLPDDLEPSALSYFLQPHVGRSESPFTRAMKTYELTAPRWLARLSYRAGDGPRWGDNEFARRGPRLDALIARLRGGAARLGLYDFRRPALSGDNLASALGNAAADAGATMMTVTGAAPGSLVMRAGDYLGGDDRAHMAQDDVTADGDGNALVRFWPPLANAIAADAAVFGNPRSYFRLVSDDAGSNPSPVGEATPYELELVEDYWSIDVDYPDLIPTEVNKLAALKLEKDLGRGPEELLLIRTLTAALAGSGITYFDEFWLRKPEGYAGVDDGWQLWKHRTFAKRRYFDWLIGPDDMTQMSLADFALRVGLYASTYASSGEGPDYAYAGFLHGRMDYVGAGSQILLDAAGADLHVPGAWPVGTSLFGDQLQITMHYDVKLFDDTTVAVNVQYTQLFDDQGLRELGEAADAGAGTIGWNDSYFQMAPYSHDHVDFIKRNGEAAIPVVGAGGQKGTSSTTNATIYQAYGAADPTIMAELELMYGQPVERPDLSLTPWQLNTFVRHYVTDYPDFAKTYVAAASSAESPPRTAWQFTGTYIWQNRRRGHYRAGGPI